MGNNKKTVKCSFCHRLGHNRVSCPKHKEQIDNLRQEFGSDHPDVSEYDNYKNLYSRKSKSNAKTVRRCSYCSSVSHNVRTCSIKSTDIIKLKKLNRDWRNNVLNELKAKGIGVGTIMANSGYVSSFENIKSPWTLVSIDWHNLSWLIDNRKVFKLILMSNPAVYREVTLEQLLNDSPSYNYRWEVLSTSDALNYPEKWNAVSDPVFDEQCVEIFKGISKAEYDTFFMSIVDQKSEILNFLMPNIGEDCNE
tara:strand:+ start:4037 stop:4789 length:753 start_codon:yes stop_codon:yes gene_type:complete